MAATDTTAALPLMMQDQDFRLGFVGAGNMAQPIIRALLDSGAVTPAQLMVSAPSDTHLAPLRQQGINTTHDNNEILDSCQVVVISVKPHIFPVVMKELTTNQPKTKLFISIMAGLTLEYLRESLQWTKACIIRSMPNTPCMVGEGCCVYAVPPCVPPEMVSVGRRILSCLGLVRQIPEEQINAAASVAGSGPAYLYLVIEALADGGVKMGLPRDLAMALAAQTARGAATMVQQTGRHPGQLKDEVCSPGGTTIAGMHALEKGAVRASFVNAVEAATLRTGELLREQQKKKADQIVNQEQVWGYVNNK